MCLIAIQPAATCLKDKDIRYTVRRLCTDRRQDAAVIFLFGLEALFTRDSRAHLSAVLYVPNYWLLLALSVI
jgi:hypothetical protein